MGFKAGQSNQGIKVEVCNNFYEFKSQGSVSGGWTVKWIYTDLGYEDFFAH